MPSGLLASSSDDDFGRHSGAGAWAGGLPLPAHAAPHQYLPVLVEYFGCSSSHQQRQLFVPLAMGLLACCHKCLSCSQQAVLLDRLEALAHDSVPGVRYAVAAALADVRVQAAALTGQQPQPDVATEAKEAAQAEQQHDSQQQAAEPEASAATQQSAGSTPAADAEGAAGGRSPAASAGVREAEQQQQQQQQEAPAMQEQQHHEDVQPAEEPAEVQQTQLVGHVPKGAHPLLGYQAYVQQLSRTSSRGGASTSSSSSNSSNAQAGSPANSSRSPAPAAAAAAASGRAASSALPPRSGHSPAVVKQLSKQNSGSKQQQQPAGISAAAEAPGKAKRAVGGQQATGTAGPVQADAAAGQQAPEAAEWLLKLSNCQQLERLMHVVALTTGPLH
jgi:hypothetical protein